MLTSTARCQGVPTKLFNSMHAFHKKSPDTPCKALGRKGCWGQTGAAVLSTLRQMAPPWKAHDCRDHSMDP